MRRDIWRALSPESAVVYNRAWLRFENFCAKVLNQSSLPASEQSVASYVAHLHHECALQANTIRANLSAINFVHSIHSYHPPAVNSFLVDKLLKAYAKDMPDSDDRLPITLPVLLAILEKIPVYTKLPRERALLSALFDLMYFGLLRVSEVAKTDGPTDHNLSITQISITSSKQPELLINFKSFKSSKSKSTPAKISSIAPAHCPVKLFTKYLITRGKFSNTSKVFCHLDSSPLTRSYISKSLNAILDLTIYSQVRYNTHSFRIGRATDLASQGASDQQIMMAGRWKSMAFKKYIRPTVVLL